MKTLLLKKILENENIVKLSYEKNVHESTEDVSDGEMVKKNFSDEFELSENGLEYIKKELTRLNKKATRIGTSPLELKIVSTKKKNDVDQITKRNIVREFYTVEIVGSSPIISGYKFIASLNHTSAGNIINISPDAGMNTIPDEYRSSTPTCDYCNTKRDRNNTFVLQDVQTKKFLKVGRSCLKNFLPDKNPEQILRYAEYLNLVLEELLIAEKMVGGERQSREHYYDPSEFLFYVCVAYLIEGKFISKRMIQAGDTEANTTSTMAQAFMNMQWQSSKFQDHYVPLIEKNREKAKALQAELEDWLKIKDWEAEKIKNPGMINFIENIQVLLKLNRINYRNANYHAATLALYLREKNDAEKKNIEKKNPKTHVGKIGEKIMFLGTLKVFKEFERQKFGYYDRGISYLMIFNDIDNQNEIVYFTNNPSVDEQDVGKSFKVQATVKKHDYSRQTQVPQTIITRAKITPA